MHLRDYTNVQRRRYEQRQPEATNLAGLEVLLHIDSFALGDTLCFASLLQAFQAKNQIKKLLVTTFWPELFKSTDQLEFLDAVSDKIALCDKFISVGYGKHRLDHVTGGMFWAAREQLSLPRAAPELPFLVGEPVQRGFTKIVIAPESLKPMACWTPEGWQRLVDILRANDYEIHNVSYENTLNLNGVIGHHGNPDVLAAMQHIRSARLFIGLSSGLSWLAWACQTPVVMISGFTKPFNEFPCHRAWNPHACTGCFNVFPNIQRPCPLFAGTPREHECHKTITPEMVLSQVQAALV